jgi:hypothetical protein
MEQRDLKRPMLDLPAVQRRLDLGVIATYILELAPAYRR